MSKKRTLEEYVILDEKNEFFEDGGIQIDSKEDFDKLFEDLRNRNSISNYIFRGCCEAKYKLYTSSQRYWIEHQLEKQFEDHYSFIDKLIENCKKWNNETLNNFFKRNGINSINALAYLSYMQHYGVPTPLLDFTSNLFLALFFAVEKGLSRASENKIDHYCSLYIVDSKNKYFSAAIEQFDEEIKSNNIEYRTNLVTFPLLLVTEKNESYRIINNVNISNQEGIFFYNDHQLKPIEEVYLELISDTKDHTKEKSYVEKFASCINIHKSLRNYVLKKISFRNATKSFVYPDNEQLKFDILKKTLEERDKKDISKVQKLNSAIDLSFTDKKMIISLEDSRELAVPLEWFPSLKKATIKQLENFHIIDGGEGIQWMDLDEVLLIESLL